MKSVSKTISFLAICLLQLHQNAYCIEMVIKETTRTEPYPLVIVRENENSPLTLAEPQKNPHGRQHFYFQLDETKLHNIIVACPNAKRGNVLYPRPFDENTQKYDTSKCDDEFVPSFIKIPTPGNENGCRIHDGSGELYAVGYPVGNDETNETEFLTIYQACRTSLITYYTFHTIQLPSFLKSYHEVEERGIKNQYQLVSPNHMPIGSWRVPTTQFSLNKFPVVSHEMDFLIDFDDYIVKSVIQIGRKLDVYTGHVLRYDYEEEAECRYIFRILREPLTKKGVALVTMLPGSKNCKFTCCEVGNKTGWFFKPQDKRSGLKKWLNIVALVPQTYICEVRDELIKAIEIPGLESMETLSIPGPYSSTQIPKEKSTKMKCDGSSVPSYFEVVVKPKKSFIGGGGQIGESSGIPISGAFAVGA